MNVAAVDVAVARNWKGSERSYEALARGGWVVTKEVKYVRR